MIIHDNTVIRLSNLNLLFLKKNKKTTRILSHYYCPKLYIISDMYSQKYDENRQIGETLEVYKSRL